MKCEIKVYDIFNNVHFFNVSANSDLQALERGREYAKRIITEGLWFKTDDMEEVFYPIQQIIKVKIKLV